MMHPRTNSDSYPNSGETSSSTSWVKLFGGVVLLAGLVGWGGVSNSALLSAPANSQPRRALAAVEDGLPVFYHVDSSNTNVNSSILRRLEQDLKSHDGVQPVNLDLQSPPAFVGQCPGASERMTSFLKVQQPHLALEVLKYCALMNSGGRGLYLDSSSVLMETLSDIVNGVGGASSAGKNVAILNDAFLPSSIHGALMYFHSNHAASNQKIAQQMLKLLTETPVETLASNPTLIPKSLYDFIATDSGIENIVAGPMGQRWYILQHSCTIEPLGGRQVTAPVSPDALLSYR